MIAFVVSLNDKRICTAGIWKGVLDVHTMLTNNLKFFVGGLDRETKEQLRWYTPKLNVGDRVLIEVAETDDVDPPDERFHYQKPQE